MNKNGMEQVGAFTPDNLIAGNRHPVDICHVIIKAGQKLARGTVLEEDVEEKGKYVILGTLSTTGNTSDGDEEETAKGVQDNAGAEAEYILAEAVDASEEDVVAPAYCAGEFAENFLIVKEGYTITDKDKKSLRNASIFLKTIMS